MKDKAKTFALASIGTLALTLAWSIGYQMAAADVNPEGLGRVFAIQHQGGSGFLILTTDGEIWDVDASSDWRQVTELRYQVPIPVDQIGYWSLRAIIDVDGDAWINQESEPWWINYGPPGGGGIPTSEESMSGVRSMFGR